MELAKRQFEELVNTTKKDYILNKRNSKNRIKIAASGLIFGIFLIHLLFASEHALVSVGGQHLFTKQQELKGLKLKNQQLNIEVKTLESLDRIALIATTQLDMSFPEDIGKSIDRKETSSALEQNVFNESPKRETNFLSSIKEIIKRTLESLA